MFKACFEFINCYLLIKGSTVLSIISDFSVEVFEQSVRNLKLLLLVVHVKCLGEVYSCFE